VLHPAERNITDKGGKVVSRSLLSLHGDGGRFNDGLRQSHAATGCSAREPVSNRARQRLVHDPAPLQPARTFLHKGVAAGRDRTGSIRSSITVVATFVDP
jgi:hypothetical protein